MKTKNKYSIYYKIIKHNNFDLDILCTNNEPNYYTLYDIGINFTVHDLDTSYQYILKRIKSNEIYDKEIITLFMNLLDKSYHILSNNNLKKEYDNSLKYNSDEFMQYLSPNNKYYADPILFEYNSHDYIFYEDYDYNKGFISCVEIKKNGNISKPQTVLKRPYHISFPFVFHAHNNIYMIPETSNNRTIELYKCLEFPSKWQCLKIIKNKIWANDTIVFNHNNIWWMFTSIGNLHNHSIFYTNSVEDNWKAHPYNHQKKLYGRAAGNIFHYKNKLLRPVQCGIPRYGYCLIFYEILELTPTSYKEVIYKTFYPNWKKNLIGTHTFNMNDNFIIIDGKTKVPKM